MEQPSPLHDEDLVLHYGPDFPSWEASLTARLSEHPTGIALLRGEPGTGKTSFIRRLMGTLQSTHRFRRLTHPQRPYDRRCHNSMSWRTAG